MQPITKRYWAKRGKRPSAKVNPKYEWTWSYGAVQMQTGESFFLVLPDLTGNSVEIFLAELAKAQKLGPEKIAILLWDGAPAHRAKLKVPRGIELFRTPPQTPELNPSERLWSPLKEVAIRHHFSEIGEMEEVPVKQMRELSKQKEYLSGMTNYHWLPFT